MKLSLTAYKSHIGNNKNFASIKTDNKKKKVYNHNNKPRMTRKIKIKFLNICKFFLSNHNNNPSKKKSIANNETNDELYEKKIIIKANLEI